MNLTKGALAGSPVKYLYVPDTDRHEYGFIKDGVFYPFGENVGALMEKYSVPVTDLIGFPVTEVIEPQEVEPGYSEEDQEVDY